MTRKCIWASIVFGFLISASILPSALADGPDPGRFAPHNNRRSLTIQTKVETRPDGVHVLISVSDSKPGERRSNTSSDGDDAPTVQPVDAPRPVLHAPSQPQTPASAARERYWSDASGIYRQTVDGRVIYLTPPMGGGVR
jgi:hypothetical protein